MKIFIAFIKIFLPICFIGFLYGFAQYKNKHHKIKNIDIQFTENESEFLTHKMVNKMLIQNEPQLLKLSKSELDLYDLEMKMRKNKMTENVEVYITPKGHLNVRITQRIPIARIYHDRKSYYIDRQGLAMPLSANHTERVPLITGIENPAMEKEVFYLIKKFNEDQFYKKQIIGAHRKSNGDYLLSTRIGKHKILLGDLSRLDHKLRKLKVFYKKKWGTETLNSYTLVNLKYKRQVICSK